MQLIWIASLAAIILASAAIANELDTLWVNFKLTYERDYKTMQEEKLRKALFAENVKKISLHNKRYDQGLETYSVKINQFADLSNEEFVTMHTGLKMVPSSLHSIDVVPFVPDPDAVIPEAFDWREKGAVTEIKNQGDCGSCWTFSATGALEGQYFLKTGKLVSLSEQNLLDCTYGRQINGCDGGRPEHAFAYVHNNDGIDSENSYPYEAKQGVCRYSIRTNVTSIAAYGEIESGNEKDLKEAVATVGPIATGINGNGLQFYSAGVYNFKDCGNRFINLNHAVVVVGYGTEVNGTDYWMIKNSWGTGWGQKGFGKVTRNANNMCGIALASSYPINY